MKLGPLTGIDLATGRSGSLAPELESIMSYNWKKLVATTLAATAVVTTLSAAPAEARWRNGGSFAGGAAVGLIGGLAVGSAFGSRGYYGNGYYGNYGNGYYGNGYSGAGYSGNSYYSSGSYDDYGSCYVERRRVVSRYGHIIGYRKVRVCE